MSGVKGHPVAVSAILLLWHKLVLSKTLGGFRFNHMVMNVIKLST